MITTQDNVYMSITTKLGKDKIFLKSFRGVEKISDLFEFQLELYIPYAVNPQAMNLDFSTLIETEATVTITINKKMRYFNGVITELTQGPTYLNTKDAPDRKAERTFFYATLRPKVWMMTLTENCLIFQKQDAITIIKNVLTTNGITFVDNTSTCGKTVSDFCVQYNESDFNFVSRLMEEEGIAYYFKHADGTHTMTLVDGSKPFEPLADTDFKTIDVSPYAETPTVGAFSLYDVRISQMVVPSKYSYTDYDFEKPATSLLADAAGTGKAREYYHYPGRYVVKDRGTSLTSMRMQALEFPGDSFRAQSDIHMLEVAFNFTLSDALHPKAIRQDIASKDFTIFGIEHSAVLEDEDSEKFQLLDYRNTVTFYKKETPYRPPKRAYIPRIYGTQTATVCGKSGEEIWTDQYNRILVKFHWDISTTKDDAVSCWIRVSQNWAHKNWGSFFIPRVGQEVVVTFLNGDPDQPLVTGCVYNATNMPPYGPDMAIKSGFKTNSSKGGGGFNEFHFDDTKGAENIFTQAQTDMTTMILDGQRTTTIKGTKGKGHDTLTLTKGNRTTTLTEGNDSLTLSKGSMTTDISDDFTMTIGKSATINIKKDCNINIDGALTIKVGKDFTLKVTQKIDQEAQDMFTIKSPQVKMTGETMCSLEGTAISIKGSSSTLLKGATVNIAGAATIIKGSMISLG
jgi:type VI secretion system secreted protein VgrG